MTVDEAGKIVARLAAAWPRHPFSRDTVALYVEQILDLDYAETAKQADALIRRSEWPPTISSLRTAVAVARVGLPEPDAAWSMVVRRWGDGNGQGDKSIVFPDEVRQTLDECGIDPYSYRTSEDRNWLRRSFIEIFSKKRARAVDEANVSGGRPALPRAATTEAAIAPVRPSQPSGDVAGHPGP